MGGQKSWTNSNSHGVTQLPKITFEITPSPSRTRTSSSRNQNFDCETKSATRRMTPQCYAFETLTFVMAIVSVLSAERQISGKKKAELLQQSILRWSFLHTLHASSHNWTLLHLLLMTVTFFFCNNHSSFNVPHQLTSASQLSSISSCFLGFKRVGPISIPFVTLLRNCFQRYHFSKQRFNGKFSNNNGGRKSNNLFVNLPKLSDLVDLIDLCYF